MRNSCLALSAILLALPVSPSAALDAHQKDAIDRLAAASGPPKAVASSMARHYAILLWVEDFCAGRSSEPVRVYLLEKGGSDKDAFETGWMDTFEMLGRTDPKPMCQLALDMYGPEGAQIKGAWAPKEKTDR